MKKLLHGQETGSWDDKMYLYPIPQAEYYKNPKLGQNAGW